METPTSSNRIHPLVAAASVSVILVSAVGVAAMTGLLPNSHSTSPPATVASVPPPPVIDTPVAATAAAEGKTESKTQATDKETVKRAASPSAEKAVASRPTTTTSSQPRTPTYADNNRVAVQAPAICYDCGRVESINAIQAEGQPTGVGMIAGGVIGGLIGNQIGGGNGKKVATVAGAVGGGYAGHQIEKQNRTTTTYQVRVRMEDGVVRTFAFDTQPQWTAGDRVRVVNGQLRSRA
jgi:outer membrane lipoprotein SlyB